ncbi:hypothetical protein [Natronosalvus halobius]|uniref:hypothetical protein n=1 Tax=Natronosalvus halobius TaxID=2953746 RepID=UPI00209E59D9|nr:hypothetical protein [Natronosalvus halobius]USZ73231.1 hypothetical protein NGM15_08025 [Natronosalvus halobius]
MATYTGTTSSPFVSSVEPEAIHVVETYTQAGTPTIESHVEPEAIHIVETFNEADHTSTVDTHRGVQIPTGPFNRVSVQALDQEGDPLDNTLYIGTREKFPTMAPLNEDSVATMYLLPNHKYTEFFVIALDDSPGYDLVWYESDATSIQSNMEMGVAYFNKNEPVTKSGLNAGIGVSLG